MVKKVIIILIITVNLFKEQLLLNHKELIIMKTYAGTYCILNTTKKTKKQKNIQINREHISNLEICERNSYEYATLLTDKVCFIQPVMTLRETV